MDFSGLTDDEFRAQLAQVLSLSQRERQENQIKYFEPVSEISKRIWESDAQTIGAGGGNRSGKTDQSLAFLVACATGVFPDGFKHLIPKRFKGPIRVRVICDDLTTTLYPVILPKLNYTKWSGMAPQGGKQGHWGWIPKYCLRNGNWDDSWSDKLRILTVLCRSPEDPRVILGESMFHFMSYKQDEGRGTDFHYILHDEPPPLHVWRESQARVMGVGGRLLLAMTFPDTMDVPMDWLFDEVVEPGMDPARTDVEWISLFSTDNANIDQKAVAEAAGKWDEATRRVRIYGQSLRHSNRVHPLFTDKTDFWCFECGKTTDVVENEADQGESNRLLCSTCRQTRVCEFNHVREFTVSSKWPAICGLDPHPRKPHYFLWVMVDPADDLWVVDELMEAGDPSEARVRVDEIEVRHELHVEYRLMDPNMGMQSASSRRGTTWQGEFADAGFPAELADDSSAGRTRLNTFLKPDERTMRPRIHIHPRCERTIWQLKRYVWDDYKRSMEKDQKQTPKPKEDDFPAILKYIMNYAPSFSTLKGMGTVHHRAGTRRGAY